MARFRTRARAVDMLGRQQIAGVPTAISELWKNAHDAYADTAIVDYFRSDRLFVLRDDGTGMTEQDFEERWLTLATESRLATSVGGQAAPPRPGYPRREILGEKGIGRLAVAAIGPQVLILSRALKDGEPGDLLVSLIHWGLFEIPGVDLEQIEIPTLTVSGGTLPGNEEIGALLDWVKENLEGLGEPAKSPLVRRIRAELDDFRTVNPAELADRVLDAPTLLDGPGAHFYIRPADSLITEDLLARERNEPSDLLKLLIGFSNTMTPGHAKPALQVEFRDHYSETAFDNVVAETEFFTPVDFETADHRITGSFDPKGQFKGTVRVFDSEPAELVVPYPKAHGHEVACGPFRIDVAYQQGELKRTLLDPEAFAAINRKLRLYGGLYIYRDGIRVLPYGNQDFDFLGFEERRSISASDYFFSYRRMFGVVETTRRENQELREKAGREGFAANEAYRTFRELLMELFYQVAFQFFRESGAQSERFYQRRGELERLDRARRRRAALVSSRRTQFARRLAELEQAIDEERPLRGVERIITTAETGLTRVATEPDPARAAEAVARVEDVAREQLRTARAALRVERPRGVALSRPLERRYGRYEDARAQIEEELLDPAQERIEQLVDETIAARQLDLARRLRLEHAVEAAVKTTRDGTRAAQRELNTAASGVHKRANELGRHYWAQVEDASARALSELASLDLTGLKDRQILTFRAGIERDLETLRDAASGNLVSMKQQLAELTWPENGNRPAATTFDQIEALETDLEALSERAAEQLDVTQLGMAVEVINHEFRQTVQSIRRTLRQLKTWSDANPKLRAIYRELKTSFDHLDGYLALFTPLQRRLHRVEVEISGAEIEEFLAELFEKRLVEAGIELVATDDFRAHTVTGFPSTLYPVFVNLVDNSVFWLSSYRGDRRIDLDAGPDWMAVRDSGPGLPPDLGDDVFEARVTTKPGGTGYGLFIARQVLEREGMKLIAIAPAPDAGAELRIIEREP
jgi:C4-dicarboxylate-specific signal transduction histidine kinase